jgi:hypothetical protein
MFKVFISSTSKDLGQYRSAAIEVCNRLGLIPLGMEFFGAMGAAATEGSKRKLNEADVYVGTFAHRYGYIEEGYDLSVTELEYDYAGERGLERLCFILDPASPWPEDHLQSDRVELLQRFLQRVEQANIRELFTSVEDYKYKLMQALIQWASDRKGITDTDHRQPPLLLQTFRVSKGTRFHFRAQRVPFIGLNTELTKLDRFLDSDPDFAWWMVTGGAGAGKSRLALELCLRRKDKWDVGFLPQAHGFDRWMRWQPLRPSLMVVDYAHVRAKELQAIVIALASRSDPLVHPVRLLLLERRSDGEWWNEFRGVGSGRAAVESSMHDDSISLRPMTEDDLWNIVLHIFAHEGLHELPERSEFFDALRVIDPLGRPLFAALAADAVLAGRDLRDWDRDALLRDVLQREREAYWRPEGITEKDRNLLTVATLSGGLHVSTLQSFSPVSTMLPTVDDRDPDRYSSDRYKVLVGRDSTDIVAPLEPNLIGEFFVLEQVRPRDHADMTRGGILCHTAWLIHPFGMWSFVERASQDFADHPGLDVVTRATEDMLERADNLLPRNSSNLTVLAVSAALGNLILHDCKQGRLDKAEARLAHLWKFTERRRKEPLVQQIQWLAANMSSTVIARMVEAGDQPRAAIAISSLAARFAGDPELSTLVVEAFGKRALEAAKSAEGDLARWIFDNLWAFVEPTRGHQDVVVAAEFAKAVVAELLKARLWNSAADVFWKAMDATSSAPRELFVVPLGLAAIYLLLDLENANIMNVDGFVNNYDKFARVLAAARPLLSSTDFEEGLTRYAGRETVSKARLALAMVTEIVEPAADCDEDDA